MPKEVKAEEYIYYEFEDIETNETVLCKIPIYIFTNEKDSSKTSDNRQAD